MAFSSSISEQLGAMRAALKGHMAAATPEQKNVLRELAHRTGAVMAGTASPDTLAAVHSFYSKHIAPAMSAGISSALGGGASLNDVIQKASSDNRVRGALFFVLYGTITLMFVLGVLRIVQAGEAGSGSDLTGHYNMLGSGILMLMLGVIGALMCVGKAGFWVLTVFTAFAGYQLLQYANDTAEPDSVMQYQLRFIGVTVCMVAGCLFLAWLGMNRLVIPAIMAIAAGGWLLYIGERTEDAATKYQTMTLGVLILLSGVGFIFARLGITNLTLFGILGLAGGIGLLAVSRRLAPDDNTRAQWNFIGVTTLMTSLAFLTLTLYTNDGLKEIMDKMKGAKKAKSSPLRKSSAADRSFMSRLKSSFSAFPSSFSSKSPFTATNKQVA